MPKYHSVETIPARVFFHILKTKDLQQLKPKSKEKGLDEVFRNIYDEYFLRSENDEAVNYLRLYNEINFLTYKIEVLKKSLRFYYQNKTTKEMRLSFIEALKEGFQIEINPDNNFTDEVYRVLNEDLGYLENELTMARFDFDAMIKKSTGKDFDYYDQLGVLSHALPNNSLIKEEMSLAVYISLEKLAKKVKPVQKNKNLA